MRYLFCFLILCSLFVINANGQSGFPSQNINGWIKNTYTVPDSGNVISRRDTSWTPTKFGMMVTWPHAGVDTLQWFWVGNHWVKSGVIDTTRFGRNISNAALTANGNYLQNWNHKQLFIDSISTLRFMSIEDAGIGGTFKTKNQLSWSANYNFGGISLSQVLRNGANSADSVSQGLFVNFLGHNTLSTFVNQTNGKMLSAVSTGSSTAPRVSLSATYTDSNSVLTGATITLMPKFIEMIAIDSFAIPSTPASTADSIYAVGPFRSSTQNNKVLKIPISAMTGLTSVGLSMPSAFTVTNSPLTSNGTLNVIGAGTALQYIRGNGTLATFDTTAIPSFYLKVRSLFSATSPLAYNTITGTISMPDAITAGNCVNCQLTINAKGLITAYNDGTIPFYANHGVFADGDTVKLGDSIHHGFNLINYVNQRKTNPPNNFSGLVLSNGLQMDTTIFAFPLFDTTSAANGYDKPLLAVGRYFNDNDSIYRAYGGAIQAITRYVYDSLRTSFYGDTAIGMPISYGGLNAVQQVFPPKSIHWNTTPFGSNAVISSDLGIGGPNSYRVYSGNSSLNGYPIAANRMGVDFARTTSAVKREMYGNCISMLTMDYRNFQGTISAGTNESGSYIQSFTGVDFYGNIYPHNEAPSKAKVLAVSTMDTVRAFRIRPINTLTSEAKNGYTIWAEGSRDTMYHAGYVGIGTSSPKFQLDVAGKAGFSSAGYPPYLSGFSTGNVFVVHGNGSYGLSVTAARAGAGGANLALYHTRSSDARQVVPLNSGDVIGSLSFQAPYDNVTIKYAASVEAYADSVVSNNIYASLKFIAGLGDIRMMINHYGNVGINKSTGISERLYVNGTTRVTDTFKLPNIISKTDTTNFKPVVVDVSGNVFEMSGWPITGTSGNTIYTGDGTLSGNRTVTGGGNTLTFTGSNNSAAFVTVSNSGTSSTGLFSLGTLYGLDGESTNGIGIHAYSANSIGITVAADNDEAATIRSNSTRGARIQSVPSTTNTVQEVLRLERGVSGSPGAAGIGGSMDYYNKVSDNTSVVSNQIISKFTNATAGAQVSQLSITGVNAGSTATLFTLDGNGNATFGTTNAIVGTATNNSATAGNIGEETNSTVSTYTNYTTTATYQNITSITLSAGDWDISAQGTFYANSATLTTTGDAVFAISTTTASISGAIEGKNIAYVPHAAMATTSHESMTIAPYRVSLSGSTTYYLNTSALFTAGNPQFVGTIRARRVR